MEGYVIGFNRYTFIISHETKDSCDTIHIQHHLGQVGETSHYLPFSFRYPRGFGYVRRNDRQVVAAHELMYRGEKRKTSGVLEKNFFKKMSISG